MLSKKILATLILFGTVYLSNAYSEVNHWSRIDTQEISLSQEGKINALVVFDNQLYAARGNFLSGGGAVYVYGNKENQLTWSSISKVAEKELIPSVGTLVEFNDKLYVGAYSPKIGSGLTLAYDKKDSTWQQAGLHMHHRISQLIVFHQKLYALIYGFNRYSVVVYDEKNQSWASVSNGYFSSDISYTNFEMPIWEKLKVLIVFNDKLYVGGARYVADDGVVKRWIPAVYVFNGDDLAPVWKLVSEGLPAMGGKTSNPAVNTFSVYQNKLFAGGIAPNLFAFVYSYNGNDEKPKWTTSKSDGLDNCRNPYYWTTPKVDQLHVYKDHLYAAGINHCGNVFVSSYNESSWAPVGDNLPKANGRENATTTITGLVSLGDSLYISGYKKLITPYDGISHEDYSSFIYELKGQK